MLYVEIDREVWIQRYQITPKIFKCKNCQKDFETSVPILIKGYAGLETPIHDCPRNFAAAVFKPISEEERMFWYGK